MVAGIAAGTDWQSIVAEKRLLRNHLIDPFLQEKGIDYGTVAEIDDVEKLAARIAGGEVKVCDVVKASILRACAAHKKSNCLTEIMFASALKRATELDTHLTSTSQPIGPLHGIPMSLKDQFDITGSDTTLGYVARSFKPAASNALLVDILQSLGAVMIAKTNLPQSIMWCETENPLFGLTTHPRDARLTPGGSSGGEGVSLAERGSMVGWGTDIGGSVRIPAHMMGLYALKPSSGRLPYEGCQVSTSGQEHVPSVVGPMARSLASIEQVTRLVIGAKPWERDPTCHPMPWREAEYAEIQSRPLVIGVLVDDGHVKVHPPVERVLLEAVKRLEAAGHVIVPWTDEGHKECVDIMDRYYTADGGEDIRTSVSAGGEPFLPHVENIITRAPAISVYEYWALNRHKRAAQKAYLEKWNRMRCPKTGRRVDVLLTPTMPHSSVPHRSCKWVGYTKVWNLLDYTAAVVPFGNVDRNVDLAKTEPSVAGYQTRNEVDAFNWGLYDPEAMHGLPLSVQIVGQRLEEEKVLGAASGIETVLGA